MTRTLIGWTLGQVPKHRCVSPGAKCDGLERRESLHTFKAPFIMVRLPSFSVPNVTLLVDCSEEKHRESLHILKAPFVMVVSPVIATDYVLVPSNQEAQQHYIMTRLIDERMMRTLES